MLSQYFTYFKEVSFLYSYILIKPKEFTCILKVVIILFSGNNAVLNIVNRYGRNKWENNSGLRTVFIYIQLTLQYVGTVLYFVLIVCSKMNLFSTYVRLTFLLNERDFRVKFIS